MLLETKTLRGALDPNLVLPEVRLERGKGFSRGAVTFKEYEIVTAKEVIGCADIGRCHPDKQAWFNHVYVHEEYRGQGYGMAAYLAAIEMAHQEGNAFRNDILSISEHAMRVWQRFINAGIAEVIEPFKRELDKNNIPVYYGHVQILPRYFE